MASNVSRKFAELLFISVPAVTCLAMILASLVPITGRVLGPVTPPLLLISIFFWSIHRPAHLPPWAAFCAGLSYDLLSGTYLGLWAFIATLISAYGLSQRRSIIAGGFVLGWLAFIIAAAGAELLAWIVVGLLKFAILPRQPVFFSALMLIGLYPPFAYLFGKLQQWGLRYG